MIIARWPQVLHTTFIYSTYSRRHIIGCHRQSTLLWLVRLIITRTDRQLAIVTSKLLDWHIEYLDIYLFLCLWFVMSSVLWRCKGIRPVKNWVVAGMVIRLERVSDLHMSQLIPLLLTVSCFSKIQIGFTFLVPAHLGSPGHRAVKWVCVCLWFVYTCLYVFRR